VKQILIDRRGVFFVGIEWGRYSKMLSPYRVPPGFVELMLMRVFKR
jgi:hypothetical protein